MKISQLDPQAVLTSNTLIEVSVPIGPAHETFSGKLGQIIEQIADFSGGSLDEVFVAIEEELDSKANVTNLTDVEANVVSLDLRVTDVEANVVSLDLRVTDVELVSISDSISGNQNDYNPIGLDTANVLRITSSVSCSITGIAAKSDGDFLYIVNGAGLGTTATTLQLPHESTSSAAANRFHFGVQISLLARQGCLLRYDGTFQRWMCMGYSSLPASQSQAEAGTDGAAMMTPVRTAQAIAAAGVLMSSSGLNALVVVDETTYAGLTPDANTVYFVIEDAP